MAKVNTKSVQGSAATDPYRFYNPQATQVAATFPGSTDPQGINTATPTKYKTNGTPAFGQVTQTEVDAKGQTWEYIDNGDGSGEWKMTKDAAGNLVGDAREQQARMSGTNVSGNSQNPMPPYNAGPANAAIAKKQEEDYIQQIINNAKANQADNKNFVDTTAVPALQRQTQMAQGADAMDWTALGLQGQARDKAAASRANLSSEQRGIASGYNQASSGMYDSYAKGQSALNDQDQGALGKYMGETDPLMQRMSARGSDAADVSRQLSDYNTLSGIGSGSLDYSADQWSSNPEDVARQEAMYGQYGRIGGGSLDYASQAAKAAASPEDLANQKKALLDIQQDVAGGDKDQREIYDLMKSRTGVKATAEEAYLAELARRKFESDDRGSRQANMRELGMRGLRSGNTEIANQLAERGAMAQDRTLAELGLQANAMQRARDYTNMSGTQANAMRGSKQNALGMQSDLSSTMRGQSFDESYKRGLGADQASRDNQGTRLSGYQLQGNQANQIRNSNDAVGTFNVGQSNVAKANNQSTRLSGSQSAAAQGNEIRNANDSIRMFQDQYAQQEAIRTGNLAGQRQTASLNTTNQIGQRNSTTQDQGQAVIAGNYGRDKDSISLDYGRAADDYAADSDFAGSVGNVGQRGYERAAGVTGSATGVASTRAGINQSDTDALITALKLGVGSSSKNAALAQGW